MAQNVGLDMGSVISLVHLGEMRSQVDLKKPLKTGIPGSTYLSLILLPIGQYPRSGWLISTHYIYSYL